MNAPVENDEASIDVDPVSRAYLDAIRATAAWRDWLAGARAEPWQPWQAPASEADTVIEDLRATT